ncbi:general amino acid permease [Spathaspora passalidarum NRRL Y-27907]|uniref:General amino acid permease n=1 Tax=Spathaspora passalidarum (strain NRRL Y-27907 / 11-Y1) TaxID=619300 RepID=G3APH6_SPAPN|nr:general amino acid permease [Spathaspora passalidarum NRRL Y-27907]EGW32147.1 general amino acid permease [Spathaspora passalidarum NRRL Y-27907]
MSDIKHNTDSITESKSKIESSSSLNSNTHELTYANQSKPGIWREFADSFKRAEDVVIIRDLENGDKEEIRQAPVLKQTLKKRQLQMIALGGCVGSGLLVVSGQALKVGGPASLMIAWAIVSSFLYCTMQSLAELSSAYPVSGSFATYAAKFVDPSWGFAMGWNYALFWVVVLPLELVAASMTIKFWNSSINSVVWIAIFYVLIIGLNLYGNKGFGETEFIASIIKLLGVVGFNILAVVLICGGGDQGYIGGKNWHPPFQTGFKGVVSVLLSATYSLAGTELVGLTTSESEGNPRKVLPKAIKQVLWRIMIFYMLTLMLIAFLVPANSPQLLDAQGSSDASASPFVIAIRAGGIKVLPSIFNVVILVALLSIGNSAVYGFSRTILALGEQGLAPKIYTYVDRKGRPLAGICTSAIVGLLSFVSASKYEDQVFGWLVSLSGLSTLFTWGSINLSFIRFRSGMRAQDRSLHELPYRSNTGVWGAYYGLIMNFVVLALQFWLALFPIGQKPSPVLFFQTYLGAIIIVVFYFGHKLFARNWILIIRAKDIDVDGGKRETDIDLLRQEIEEEKEHLKSQPLYYRMYQFWC